MASFPDWSSILPIFCPFCSPSRCFCHLSPVQRPVLHGFRSSDQNELFNNLVAQFVGGVAPHFHDQIEAFLQTTLKGLSRETVPPKPASAGRPQQLPSASLWMA